MTWARNWTPTISSCICSKRSVSGFALFTVANPVSQFSYPKANKL